MKTQSNSGVWSNAKSALGLSRSPSEIQPIMPEPNTLPPKKPLSYKDLNDQEKAAIINDLTGEGTLFQTWKAARRISPSTTNVGATLVSLIALAAYASFAVTHNVAAHLLSQQTRTFADLGLTFSTTVLGFLIAGFTIFAALSRPELFTAMAKFPDPQYYKATGFSFLKTSFLKLVRVFAEYWLFTSICLFIKIFCYEGGPVPTVLNLAFKPVDATRAQIDAVVFVILGTLFVYVVMSLQSFIFNIYHFVMMGAKWDVKSPELAQPADKQSPSPPEA